MITKTPLDRDRVRKIAGSFAFVEHRFLRRGFFSVLTHHELLLYIFLVLVSDRNGLSPICRISGANTDFLNPET